MAIKKAPRVLMFGWELPPHNSGGLGVACYGITKGLSALGVPISFAMPRKLPTSTPFMDVVTPWLPGVKFTALNSLLQAYLIKHRYQVLLSATKEKEQYGISLYEEALRFGRLAGFWAMTQKHELIHAHDWMTFPAAMQAAKHSKKPWIAHVHATEFDRTGGYLDKRIAEIEYEGLHKADQVIAVSGYEKEMVIKHYGVPRSHIAVVHNGIDMLEFQPMDLRRVFPHDKIVLFVGRLTFQKGIDYLLKAAKRVLDREPNTIFVIAGSGDMEQRLIMQAAYMGIGQRIIFTGFVTGEKLKMLYSMADLFIMPSVSEPYGLVALEAIASGTPTIISKQSGVGETLPSVFKVDFWDTDLMADQMVYLLSHPDQAREVTRKARSEAEKRSWNQAASEVLSVYHSMYA